MLPAGSLEAEEPVPPLLSYRQALYQCIIPQAVTHSIAPEDGRNNRPKRVELIGINNKPAIVAGSW